MVQRYGSVDMEEYNRVKEESRQAKVSRGCGRGLELLC
jgi:hypothetical protein